MSEIKCSRCGKALPDDAADFCSVCQTSVSERKSTLTRGQAIALMLSLAGADIFLAHTTIECVRNLKELGAAHNWPVIAFLALTLCACGLAPSLLKAARGNATRRLKSPSYLEMAVTLLFMLILAAFGLWFYTGMLDEWSRGVVGDMDTLRSGLALFSEDHQGRHPQNAKEFVAACGYYQGHPERMQKKILGYTHIGGQLEIPKARSIPHGWQNTVLYLTSAEYRAGRFTDMGGWAYVMEGTDQGAIMVNCTHKNTSGHQWTSY